MTDGPLIVQSDKSLLLEVDHPGAAAARAAIAPFAELEHLIIKQLKSGEVVWFGSNVVKDSERRAGRFSVIAHPL